MVSNPSQVATRGGRSWLWCNAFIPLLLHTMKSECMANVVQLCLWAA